MCSSSTRPRCRAGRLPRVPAVQAEGRRLAGAGASRESACVARRPRGRKAHPREARARRRALAVASAAQLYAALRRQPPRLRRRAPGRAAQGGAPRRVVVCRCRLRGGLRLAEPRLRRSRQHAGHDARGLPRWRRRRAGPLCDRGLGDRQGARGVHRSRPVPGGDGRLGRGAERGARARVPQGGVSEDARDCRRSRDSWGST